MKQVILCFGNEWHGDDGFGSAVYKGLHEIELPPQTELIFYANNSLMIPREQLRASRIIIVDAFQTEVTPPGQIHWESASNFTEYSQRNMHDGGVEEFIRHLPILTKGTPTPQVDILYITVAPVSCFTPELSSVVAEKINTAVLEIQNSVYNWEVVDVSV